MKKKRAVRLWFLIVIGIVLITSTLFTSAEDIEIMGDEVDASLSIKPGTRWIDFSPDPIVFDSVNAYGFSNTISSYAKLSDWQLQDYVFQNTGWTVSISASPLVNYSNQSIGSGYMYLTNATRSVSAQGGEFDSSMATSVMDQAGVPQMRTTFTSGKAVIDQGSIPYIGAKAGYGQGKFNVTEPNQGLLIQIPISDLQYDPNDPNKPNYQFTSTITFTMSPGELF